MSKAQSISFLLSQVRASGVVIAGGTVDAYQAGSTTIRKTIWQDRDKAVEADNPYQLDANGTAHLFGDGLYRIVIKDASGVVKYDRDGLSFRDVSGNTYDVSDYASLAAAVVSIGSAPATLQFAADVTVSSNLVIPSTLELMPLNGAKINHTTYTISYAGSTARWPLSQVFNGTGLVTLSAAYRPEWFGAKPDGITNSFPSFKKIANAINSTGTGQIIGTPGTYYFDEYVVDGDVYADKIVNFIGVTGLTIDLNGATISIKGDFYRGAARPLQISGLVFTDCERVIVRNGAIDGNVDLMTRDPGVSEGISHGIVLYGSNNVVIDNMEIHHMSADGVYVGSSGTYTPARVSRHLVMKKANLHNNARQGLTVAQLYGGYFENCIFSYSGDTEGAYGGHAPAAGVDVEPNFNTVGVNIDSLTGDLSFVKCDFSNSTGSQFIATYSNRFSDRIGIDKCTFRARASGGVVYNVQLSGPNSSITNSTLLLGGSYINTAAGDTPTGRTSVAIKNCYIESSLYGIIHTSATGQHLEVENCYLKNTATSAFTSGFPLITATSGDNVFRYNTVFMPSTAHDGVTSSVAGKLENMLTVEGNKYITDLSSTTLFFNNSYSGTTCVRNEDYTYNYLNREFRPSGSTTMDTRRLFSAGDTSSGTRLILAELTNPNNNLNAITFQSAKPTTGLYQSGDVVYRAPQATGQPIAWSCTATGGATSTTRANTTAYSAGVWAIWTTGTTVWSVSVAGTSAGAAPSIVGKIVGDTVVDGTVTWKLESLTTAILSPWANL